MAEFEHFPSIPRLSRECVITEKIDGTNAQIYIGDDGTFQVGSRNLWLTDSDHFGFHLWAQTHKEQLIIELGIGRHFGEWWGGKIQRGYGVKEKSFSLFNTHRWKDAPLVLCKVVPVLYEGPFSTAIIEETLHALAMSGSIASPGFMRPEGVVIFHKAGNYLFKKTFQNDEGGKNG